MAISLPRRSSGTTARSRGINLPAAANVPKTSAGADPGLPRQSIPSSVPQGAFGGPQARGLQSLGQGVSDLGFGVQQAAVRQQKRYDATRTTEALLAFERESMEEFRRRQTEDDPARPKFMPDFENDLKGRREKALKSLEDVSPDAVEDLSLRLESSANGMVDAAGRLSLQASQKAADDAMAGTVNQLSAQAERDPDFLKSILSEGASRLSVFNGTMTADQKRDQLQKARQKIILSSVAGLIKSGRTLDAKLLLDGGEYDEDLTREQRAQAETMIRSGETQAVKNADKAEAAAEKAVKLEQDNNAALLTDGILEGTSTDFDLDLALARRDIRSEQFISARKLLKAQETEDAAEDDPEVVLALTRELDAGTLTKGQVVEEFANKNIIASTMNRLRGEIDAGPDDFRINEERRMLMDAVGGRPGPLAILDSQASRRVNDAAAEFNDRVRKGEDARDVRKDIESRAGEVRNLKSFIRPRFMVGPDISSIDVIATKKATLKAYRERQITTDQLKREVDNIKGIEEALERKQ